LHAIGEALAKIVEELRCDIGITTWADHPARHNLGIGIDGDPEPHVTGVGILRSNLRGDVLGLGVAERPLLINLNTTARKIPENAILILRAQRPYLYQ
jgi:hypothetical protein